MFSRINLKRHAIEQAAATDILSQRFLLILELMMDLLEARCGLEY
jgi:hypothetical protein